MIGRRPGGFMSECEAHVVQVRIGRLPEIPSTLVVDLEDT